MDLQQAMAELCDQVADKVVERLQRAPDYVLGENEQFLEQPSEVTGARMAQAVEAAAVAAGGSGDELESALRTLQATSDEIDGELERALTARDEALSALRAATDKATSLKGRYTSLLARTSNLALVALRACSPILAEQRKQVPAYTLPMPTLIDLRKLEQSAHEAQELLEL